MAVQRRQWPIAAAHAALGFFTRPSRESFQQLLKAASEGDERAYRRFLHPSGQPLA